MPKSESAFATKCYKLLCSVPSGKVTTYKALGEALGIRGYRAIGQVLNKNPYAPKVPCHRVVCSDGSIGGFAKGTEAKIDLLKKEGVSVSKELLVVGFKDHFVRPVLK